MKPATRPSVAACIALVPIKPRAQGKTRLDAVLTHAGRTALVRSLLAHALGIVQRAPAIDRVVVLSAEHNDVPDAVELMVDRGDGDLNAALVDAIEALRASGDVSILIIHPDLPSLTVEDVEDVIASGRRAGIALAVDRHDSGTNALFLDSRVSIEAFAPHFGADSYKRHVEAAREAGIAAAIVRRPGLANDVDTPADLALLAPALALVSEG